MTLDSRCFWPLAALRQLDSYPLAEVRTTIRSEKILFSRNIDYADQLTAAVARILDAYARASCS
jgi:hypothetical protein